MYHLLIFLFIYYFISICLILSVGQQASSIYLKTMEEYHIERTLPVDIVSILIIVSILPILYLSTLINNILGKDD